MGKSWKDDQDSTYVEEADPIELFNQGKLTAKKCRKEMQRLGYSSDFIKQVLANKEQTVEE